MKESKNEIVESVKLAVQKKFEGEGTGHDWHHINRVRKLALTIAQKEGADLYITELGALLHDIADHKFHNGDLTVGPRHAEIMLNELGVDEKTVEEVRKIVSEVSFKGAGVPTPVSSLESACVQDADRIDALGAIGIGRTFAYGGSVGNPLHEPEISPEQHNDFKTYTSSRGSTINHFYEKLLLLKDRMNTGSGKEIANGRHEFMEQFLNRFYSEWDGEC